MSDPTNNNYQSISDIMEDFYNQFIMECPHHIIILKDTEIEGMILKAGTYIDGVRQDD